MDEPKERKRLTENFFADEFECKCGCGLNNIHPEIVRLLQVIRDEIKRPLVITSGSRCIVHNAKVGGTSTSDHLLGIAVDIDCFNALDRRELVQSALKAGVPTLGINKKFIHISTGYPARIYTYD